MLSHYMYTHGGNVVRTCSDTCHCGTAERVAATSSATMGEISRYLRLGLLVRKYVYAYQPFFGIVVSADDIEIEMYLTVFPSRVVCIKLQIKTICNAKVVL